MNDAHRRLPLHAAYDLVTRAQRRVEEIVRRLTAHLGTLDHGVSLEPDAGAAADSAGAADTTARGLHADIDDLAMTLVTDDLEPARRLLEDALREDALREETGAARDGADPGPDRSE